MTIRLSLKPRLQQTAVFIPVSTGQNDWQESWDWFLPTQRKLIRNFLTDLKPGSDGEVHTMTLANSSRILRLVFVGIGDRKKYSMRKFRLRIRQIIQQVEQYHVASVDVSFQDFLPKGDSVEWAAQQLAEQCLLAEYTYQRKSQKPKHFLKNLTLVVDKQVLPKIKTPIRTGQIIAEYVNSVRSLCNTPGGEMTPTALAKQAKALAQQAGAACEVFGEQRMKALGMGGILGVSRGSTEEAQFIQVKHLGGPKSEPPVVLIGKGITFDTGGLNLKPDKAMEGMHLDMSGAAAVIGTACLAAKLKLPVNVIALAPAAENMPSGSGYRPGDVLTTISGKTIEVKNTDAEGRIILADALGYAKRFSPRLVIDVATLTGAAMVALGYRAAAIFTQDDVIAHALEHLAEESGDYVWRLPLWEEYGAEVKGGVADVQNTGKYPLGGAITAAHFLKNFAEGYPWVHIDMAPVEAACDDEFLAKGSKGSMVRLLIHLLRTKSKHTYGSN